MTEQSKKPEAKKASPKVKVKTKRSVWLSEDGEKAKKVKAGVVVELSAELVKHFGSAVTKDFDEGDE